MMGRKKPAVSSITTQRKASTRSSAECLPSVSSSGLTAKNLSRAPDGLTGLMVVSGHDYPLVLAAPGPEGVTFSDDLKWIEAYEGNVVILDPLVSLHHCQENDNSALDALVKRLGRIAATPPIKSIELVHHARKPAQGGNVEISTADARGASAIAAGARSVRVLNRITEGEALRANVKDSRRFFRADAAKTNYTAGAVPSHWYQHVSIILPNGDDVGVVAPWQFPG